MGRETVRDAPLELQTPFADKGANQGRIVFSVACAQEVVVEERVAVRNSLCLLKARFRNAPLSFAKGRSAAQKRRLLQDQDAKGALFIRHDGGGQAGRARSRDDDVEDFGLAAGGTNAGC